MRCRLVLLAGTLFLANPFVLQAGDWPMWRYDADRSGARAPCKATSIIAATFFERTAMATATDHAAQFRWEKENAAARA